MQSSAESSTPSILTVAFQGEPGAYSEAAAIELLGKAPVRTVGLESFEHCFEALQKGEVDFTLLPMENSLGGSIHANYDMQLRHSFFIVAELNFRVRHCIMALPGVTMEQLKTVYSHPQALAQCDGYLRQLGKNKESRYDTAGSAKLIKKGNLTECAAIASELAAEYYGLNVLDKGIEDDDNNFTRFLLLSKRWLPLKELKPYPCKTSLVFALINYPGCLVTALSAFSSRGVSLTKLESRPDKLRNVGIQLLPIGEDLEEQQIPDVDREILEGLDISNMSDMVAGGYPRRSPSPRSPFEDPGEEMDAEDGKFQFIFYVDCKGSLADRSVQNAIRHLTELATFLRVLGTFPKGGLLVDYVAEAAGADQGSKITHKPRLLRHPSSGVPLKIGILGFGNFGQFLAKTFTKQHEVFACSRTDYSQIANQIGVHFTDDVKSMFRDAQGLDCLVISVSILSFESVLRHVPMELLKHVLVVDVLSVKILPRDVMKVILPPEADILCTHPMFGPESGRCSWKNLPCVYEKVQIGASPNFDLISADRRCERFLDIFRREGCRMVQMSCDVHDEAAAGSQFVTHFTGRMLANLNLRSTPINTKGFETLLTLVDNTCKDSFDLFSALYQCNPNSSAQLEALHMAMRDLTEQLKKSAQKNTGQPVSATELSEFVGRIRPSKTSQTHALALELKRQGKDIVTTLTVGEPDFDPPKPVMDAVVETIKLGLTRYTPVGGWFSLKEAIANDYRTRKNVSYDPNTDILATHGGKQAIFCAVMALCGPQDEVVIPAPCWVSYPEIVRLSGAKPVIVERDPKKDYILQPEDFEAALTERTRIFILCNPCNPTGCTYTIEDLEKLAAVLRKPEYKRVLVLTDEIYERLTYDGVKHHSFASLDGLDERTMLVNGFAKGFAMTGFRLGYLASKNKAIIDAALKLQSQLNSCPSSISQHAGIAALTKVTEDMLEPLYAGLKEKRDKIVSALRDIPHITCPVPKGAFYVFPDVSYYLRKNATSKQGRQISTSTDLCTFLIEEHGLALPPGDAFGAPYGVRFSYAASMEDIEKAVVRFRAGLIELKNA